MLGSVGASPMTAAAPKPEVRDRATSPLRQQQQKQEQQQPEAETGQVCSEEQEIIVPIVEALGRINELKKAADSDEDEEDDVIRWPLRSQRYWRDPCFGLD